jgi:hypothetical protein
VGKHLRYARPIESVDGGNGGVSDYMVWMKERNEGLEFREWRTTFQWDKLIRSRLV